MFTKEPYRDDRMSDDQYRILMILAQFKLTSYRVRNFIENDNYLIVVYNDTPHVVKFEAVSERSWLESKYCTGKGHYEIITNAKEAQDILDRSINNKCLISIKTKQTLLQKMFNRFDITIYYELLIRTFYNVNIHNITRGEEIDL